MIVWLIRHDVDHYSALGLEQETHPNPFLQFSGERLGFRWHPLTVRIEEHNALPLPDFPYLGAKVLAASDRAAEILRLTLQDTVEFLELIHEEKQFYAINVLTVLNCLDKARSEFERFQYGGIKRIKRHQFRAACVEGHRIFKIPETNCAAIYVNDEVKQLIEDAQLTGLEFYKVWEG